MNISTVTTDLTTALKTVAGLGNRVFPIVATEGTQMPFAIYQRDSMSETGTKDGATGYDMTFSVSIVSATYLSGLELTDAVVQAIHHMTGTYNYEPVLIASTETYTENEYVQTLTFRV